MLGIGKRIREICKTLERVLENYVRHCKEYERTMLGMERVSENYVRHGKSIRELC